MRWKTDAVLVAAVLLFGQIGVFYLAAYRCALGLASGPRGSDDLTALVVSDVHLLGKRRRTLVERLWIDMQISTSLRAAVRVHKPDVVLVLGDQLDEGGYPTSDTDFQDYVTRFKAAFASTENLPTVFLIGNHDSAFGRFLTPAAIARHERAFGPSNFVTTIKGHKVIQLNTMALDSDVTNVEIKAQASSFLQTLSRDAAPASQSVILLTHFPLYRDDDLGCGADRVSEHGHVTYEHPSFQYTPHHHVVSKELSHALLQRAHPAVVLSGHTHAWCEFSHGSATTEFTIPAFSWGQRPDPSYALLVAGGGRRGARVSRCALPREPLLFALYGAALGVLVLRVLWRCVMMSRRRSRLQHQQKKLK